MAGKIIQQAVFGWSTRRLIYVGLALATLVPVSRASARVHRIAVLPTVVRNAIEARRARELDAFLLKRAAVGRILIDRRRMAKILRADPKEFAARCQANPRCLATAGRRLGVHTVLIAFAEEAEGFDRLRVASVHTASRSIRYEIILDLAPGCVEKISDLFSSKLNLLLGKSRTATLPGPQGTKMPLLLPQRVLCEAPPVEALAEEPPALASAPPPPPAAPAPPDPSAVADSGLRSAALSEKSLGRKVAFAQTPEVAAGSSQDPVRTPAGAMAQTKLEPTRGSLSTAAFVSMASGLALLGVAGYFFYDTMQLSESQEGETQLERSRRYDERNDAATFSAVFGGAGAAGLVTGGILYYLDTPRVVEVNDAPGGPGLGLVFGFRGRW